MVCGMCCVLTSTCLQGMASKIRGGVTVDLTQPSQPGGTRSSQVDGTRLGQVEGQVESVGHPFYRPTQVIKLLSANSVLSLCSDEIVTVVYKDLELI